MNAQKSGHQRKSEHQIWKIWRTHKSLDNNAQNYRQERMKVWTLTHESLDLNARKYGHECMKIWLTHKSLDMNAQNHGQERMKFWT